MRGEVWRCERETWRQTASRAIAVAGGVCAAPSSAPRWAQCTALGGARLFGGGECVHHGVGPWWRGVGGLESSLRMSRLTAQTVRGPWRRVARHPPPRVRAAARSRGELRGRGHPPLTPTRSLRSPAKQQLPRPSWSFQASPETRGRVWAAPKSNEFCSSDGRSLRV